MRLPNRVFCLVQILFLLLFLVPARSDQQLRQKIAQMMMIGFNGTVLPESVRVDLAGRNLGGVILLGRNCTSPAQLQQLTTAIRTAAQTGPFIAVDQEGGHVARLNQSNGFDSTHSAYTLGTTYHSLDSTTHQAARMAEWLRTSGFTTTFAPVVDVNVNPQSPAIGHYGRSFSSNPVTVAQHAQSFIDAFHADGVMTAVKHFPGHGSAGTDSHLQLPDITQTWADSEMIPYRILMEANRLDMVMMGHLYNAHIDSVFPSSLSRKAITNLLRDSLGYNGVVISDDLYGMRAITDRYSYGKAAELAINGGTDILLYVWNTLQGGSLLRHMIDTIETKVQSGLIAESRINESYARIQHLKARYNVSAVPLVNTSSSGLPTLTALFENYPNPFNPSTTIPFSLARTGFVTLKVYDLLGREVATLVSDVVDAGTHEVRWNASIGSGVYFCEMSTGSFRQTKRMVMVK